MVKNERRERWPNKVSERLEILYPYKIGPNDTLTYEWHEGYEKLTVNHKFGGSLEYSGMFHPVEGLCIGNPCRYCGMTWWEDWQDEGGEG